MQASNSRVSTVTIKEAQAGQRIDNFLVKHLKGVPKSHIYRLLRSGQVRINSGRKKPHYKLEAGDKLRIPPLRLPENTDCVVHESVIQTIKNKILFKISKLL